MSEDMSEEKIEKNELIEEVLIQLINSKDEVENKLNKLKNSAIQMVHLCNSIVMSINSAVQSTSSLSTPEEQTQHLATALMEIRNFCLNEPGNLQNKMDCATASLNAYDDSANIVQNSINFRDSKKKRRLELMEKIKNGELKRRRKIGEKPYSIKEIREASSSLKKNLKCKI